MKVPNVLVECDWLHENLHDDSVIVLNATIPKVTAKKGEHPEKNDEVIPTSRFFDIKKTFSDLEADFPNTMLSAKAFEKKAQQLGINQDSCIIIYDDHGIYSSPRAWWMFKSMGFDNVAVLNGGLPEWKAQGYQTTKKVEQPCPQGNFQSQSKELFIDHRFVLESSLKNTHQILDARSAGRFEGTAPEPREGVRSGHIPNSKSLPYSSLLNGNKLKNKEELQSLFEDVNSDKSSMIFSCGTGITACVLALGATISNHKDFLVYDGSWTEWGSLLDLPVEV